MAPKSKNVIYVVWSDEGPESGHTTLEAAVSALKNSKHDSSIKELEISGGTISIDKEASSTTKTKSASKKVVKTEDKESKDDSSVDTKEPVARKTKTPAQQRADNASKAAKPADADLPANVTSLLKKGGKSFDGKTVVVTGVPPTLGRKNTERLVEAFGAHLGKSLSRKTDYVVVGNDAGPKKLLQIDELGLKTLDEDDLISFLENDVANLKREATDDEEESKPKAARAKRQKT